MEEEETVAGFDDYVLKIKGNNREETNNNLKAET